MYEMYESMNGLLKHKEQIQIILQEDKIDLCLISETHFTRHTQITFENYNINHTIHPSNFARGGTGLIVKKKTLNIMGIKKKVRIIFKPQLLY